MATNLELVESIYAKFDSSDWTTQLIEAYPADYNGDKPSNEYITISIIVGGSERKYGGGKGPTNGALVCEIFTTTGQGQSRTAVISDALDNLLENTYLSTGVDFQTSFVGTPSQDTANSALSRAIYTLPFKTYGEI